MPCRVPKKEIIVAFVHSGGLFEVCGATFRISFWPGSKYDRARGTKGVVNLFAIPMTMAVAVDSTRLG